MQITYKSRMLMGLAFIALALAGELTASESAAWHPERSAAAMLIPNARRWAGRPGAQAVELTSVNAGVVILEQTATTTLELHLRNPGNRPQEAVVLLPVPENAVLRGFVFAGGSQEPTATLLKREEARQTYDAIVAKLRDPALLEFAGLNLIRSSVFPVPAGGEQTIRITYEQLLTAEGARIDYVLPRSETMDNEVPWTVAVKIQSSTPIATVYSPSHAIETVRGKAGSVAVRLTKEGEKQAGPFHLSWLKSGDGVSASLLAYPDPSIGGGYFLLLAGLPVKAADAIHASPVQREVTLVIDCSGSMAGAKLEQARAAALQVVRGLEPGEAFNVISYNNTVEMFAAAPVVKDETTLAAAEKFIQALTVSGGTNIYNALLEALRQKTVAGRLPLVLFLTDGLPTIGRTSEKEIRELASKFNPHRRRIFTFGVGADLNTPLLDVLATASRGTATYALEKENVTEKMNGVFEKLRGPVFANPVLLAAASADGKPRLEELLPAALPDLYEGDQLVVLGRYTGEAPLTFTVFGDFLGAQRTFQFTFDLSHATTKNAFVPRLWAARKIERLIDRIRQSGADTQNPAAVAQNPDFKATVEEIVALSTRFGVLTEYTAFLALDGTDLSRRDTVLAEAQAKFQERALGPRSGASSVNQEVNKQMWQAQSVLNRDNAYWDDKMNRVEVTGVRQVNDRTYYKRGSRWIDSQVAEAAAAAPKRQIEFGSVEYKQLVTKLVAENRQGSVALPGEVVLMDNNEAVLVKAPAAVENAAAPTGDGF